MSLPRYPLTRIYPPEPGLRASEASRLALNVGFAVLALVAALAWASMEVGL